MAERAEERDTWNKIFSTLQGMLRQGATRAHQMGKMEAADKEKYFISGNYDNSIKEDGSSKCTLIYGKVNFTVLCVIFFSH